jgi:hypothetical protein
MRLIASHGPAQSQCLTIVAHWSTIKVIGFYHRANQDTIKDLPSVVLVSLLKPSADVLRQYPFSNMDLRRATYLTIALLPNHEKTSIDVSFNVPVRPPFAVAFPEPSGHRLSNPRSLPVLERPPLRNEVTEGGSGSCIDLRIYEFLMGIERLPSQNSVKFGEKTGRHTLNVCCNFLELGPPRLLISLIIRAQLIRYF